VKDESVDLVYLDPPFKSNQDNNVLFAERGVKAAAQIKAFEDTWVWDRLDEELQTSTRRRLTGRSTSESYGDLKDADVTINRKVRKAR
jgi:16S rRNA G966 N2-methylase RsmD